MGDRHDDILAAADVAAQLQRSVATLERWRRLCVGPPWLRIRGRVMYRRGDVDTWLAAQRHATREAA
jgi:hypothetical protein